MTKLEEALRVPFPEIISGYGIEIKREGRLRKCLCPFHNDKHPSMVVYDDGYKCFSCGEHGDGINFVEKMENCSTNDAIKHILGESFSEKRIEAQNQVKKKEYNKKRDPEYLHKVYSAFVRACDPLSDKHREHLLNIRKLTDLSSYFEWPKNTSAFWKRFVSELSKEGLEGDTSEVLKFVPGFFFDKSRGLVSFTSYNGFGIIQRGFDRKITCLQARKNSDNGGKYKIFSSGFATVNDEQETSINGASIGSVMDVVMPEGRATAFAITEGHFKAVELAKKGMITLSLNGVTGQKPAIDFIKKAKDLGATKIYLAFDMDLMVNEGVMKCALKILDKIEESELRALVLFWDIHQGKGIDDYILSGGDSLKTLTAEQFRNILKFNEGGNEND